MSPRTVSPESDALPRRVAWVDGLAGLAFLAAAVALVTAHPSPMHVRWDVAALLVAAFAVALRAQFDAGTGYVPPIQLVFVPALFLEPPELVPFVALVGWTVGRLPDVVAGRMHASRLLRVPANCWFTIGPAAVLAAAGAPAPDWGDAPLYVGALAAQFGGDLAASFVRASLAEGVPPVAQLRVIAYVWLIDAALSPIGLLAAFGSVRHRFAFVAVLPLAGLLVLFSRERTRRFEAEREIVRARESLIAGASHELQTPLAVISGVVEALVARPDMPLPDRALSYRTAQRQTEHLRHMVGQFVDYASLKAGHRLPVSPRPTPLAPLLESVATTWRSQTRVEVAPTDAVALVDPGRLHSVLMSLVDNAVKHARADDPVRLSARREGERVMVEVADRGAGLPQDDLELVFDELHGIRRGAGGVGLYLARAALRAQGADVTLRNEGGLVATVDLPAADQRAPARQVGWRERTSAG